MRKFVIVLSLMMVVAHVHGQKYKLTLNLEEGKEYIQKMTSKATIKQQVGGQNMNMSMAIGGDMSYLVESVNAVDFDLSVAYKSMTMTMNVPQGPMEFSSENASEDDIMSLILAGMTNRRFQVKMTKYGTVQQVKELDKLFESAFAGLPDLSEEQLGQLKNQILKAYGEEAFRGSIEMITAIYPRDKVKIGDDWVVRTKLTSGMSADVTTKYTLVEKTKEHYILTGQAKIFSVDTDEYIETNGMQVKVILNGTMESDIKIDRVSGWIVEAKIIQEMSGNSYIKPSPQLPDGLAVPMEMESDMMFTGN